MDDDTDARIGPVRTPRTVALARVIREARGTMLQVDFAKAMKRPQSVISTWEHGKTTPNLETLHDLEQRLGLPAGTMAFRAGYFTAEAIDAEVPATPRFQPATALPDGIGVRVVERQFDELRDALRAVRAADDLGLGVRLTKAPAHSTDPVAWVVEVLGAGGGE
jgi:transcriptional regulator with XRE-family HTH domain